MMLNELLKEIEMRIEQGAPNVPSSDVRTLCSALRTQMRLTAELQAEVYSDDELDWPIINTCEFEDL